MSMNATAAFRRTLYIVACVGVCLAHPAGQIPEARHDVRVELRVRQVVLSLADPLEFDLTIRNTGQRSILLSGGALLNGHQYWTAIGCTMTNPSGDSCR